MDDLDFVMEMLKDELNITTETAQANYTPRRGAPTRGPSNIANRPGFVSPQVARQMRDAVAHQAPGSASAQKPTPIVKPAPNPANTARPTPAKPTPAPVAPKPTPAATPPKPATSTPAPSTNQPKTGNIIDRTRSIIQSANNGDSTGFDSARMAPKQKGNIKERITAILDRKSPVEKQRLAAVAHYNALTNNGTQSVPAGKMPTTTWRNTGDSKAADAAGAAQRSQVFNTNPGQGANTGSTTSNSSSTNSAVPTRGGSVPKTK